MLAWLLLPLTRVSSRSIVPITTVAIDSTEIPDNSPLIELIQANSSEAENTTVLFDPSMFISLRENDWRDDHPNKMIIWSVESSHHPEFGKNFFKGRSLRLTRSSQLMSFVILGSVIGFIVYTYLSHVITTRKLKRQNKEIELRKLIRRSRLIMAGSAQNDEVLSERRRSLINMFKGFKL